jgi:hypothetical protein
MHYIGLLKARREQLKSSEGALEPGSGFARAYNTLLVIKDKLTYDGQFYFYDGQQLTRDALIRLRLLCAERHVHASLEVVRQAAVALAIAQQASDPWEATIGTMLGGAIVAQNEGLVAKITIRNEPFWFVCMRDIKLSVGATGADGARRIRAVMRTLGWRQRPAVVWGRRMRGFARKIDLATGEEAMSDRSGPKALLLHARE